MPLGVMILDLDYFKRVNDRLGHEAGDKLLTVLGERMALACQRVPARAARLGGDEFCVLFRAPDEESAAEAARSWLLLLVGPIPLGLEVLAPAFSSGLAWGRGAAPADALRKADVAMYQAKKAGRGRMCTYDSATAAEGTPRRERQLRLAAGVAACEMVAMYQPAVESDSGACVAFEMFACWRPADAGEVRAVDFMPLAQESGVSCSLDLWMASQAVKASAAFGDGPQIRLNVDSKQVSEARFVEELSKTWAGARPNAFAVEIMESSALPDVESAKRFAAVVAGTGQEVCLDNFGAGTASIGVLGRITLGSVKIDAALARAPLGSPSRMLGRSACQVAAIHGLRCIATGVQCVEEAAILAEWGAHAMQGQAIAEPMELSAARAWLDAWRLSGRQGWMETLCVARLSLERQ